MASDWMVQRVQGTAPAVKPTVAPVVPQQVPVTKTPVAPVKTPTTDKWTSPQGKFMTGNLIQKAFDIPQVFNYGFAGFQKAGLDEKKRQIATRETESKGYLENIGKRFVAGAKGILPGVQNRTMVGAEEGNVDIGGELGIKNKYAKGAYNFGVNMAIPSLAVSKIPGVKQGANLIAKGVSKGADVVRKIEPVAKALEKVPGLEYFRNPAAGKIIQGATDTTGRRVSGLFNVISDTAKGLKPDELEEVGRIIEGKGTTTNVALITRANYIRDISNKIGQELVDTGIMSAETLAKYQNQGGYLAHIADQVRNLERSGQRGSSVLKFATTSLKERKGKLGGAGQPDYIRQFQFPTFKSLGGEITTLESTKAIKE